MHNFIHHIFALQNLEIMKKSFYNYVFFTLTLFLFYNHVMAQVKPETMRQIQLLQDEKASRTPAQQKMDSRLIQALKEHRGQKMAEGVNLASAAINVDSAGCLNVDIDG